MTTDLNPEQILAGLLPLFSQPFEVSDMVPLQRRYRPTGAVMADVACVRIGGRLIFHPQRLAEFKAALARPPGPTSEELASWADDGGAQP